VLIVIHPVQVQAHTLLMLRPTYPGVHSAQVGFPGGHSEPSDVDLRATALREFHEEIGASLVGMEILGELTPLYIPPSRTVVTPVIACTNELGPLSPDPNEVERLIPVPVAELLRDDILKRTRLHVMVMDRELDVPYWDVQGHVVWGATALMIAELRRMLGAGVS
jgi:8-oxo-dGTP pyrophosphatase MutT (NUDIX family)